MQQLILFCNTKSIRQQVRVHEWIFDPFVLSKSSSLNNNNNNNNNNINNNTKTSYKTISNVRPVLDIPAKSNIGNTKTNTNTNININTNIIGGRYYNIEYHRAQPKYPYNRHNNHDETSKSNKSFGHLHHDYDYDYKYNRSKTNKLQSQQPPEHQHQQQQQDQQQQQQQQQQQSEGTNYITYICRQQSQHNSNSHDYDYAYDYDGREFLCVVNLSNYIEYRFMLSTNKNNTTDINTNTNTNYTKQGNTLDNNNNNDNNESNSYPPFTHYIVGNTLVIINQTHIYTYNLPTTATAHNTNNPSSSCTLAPHMLPFPINININININNIHNSIYNNININNNLNNNNISHTNTNANNPVLAVNSQGYLCQLMAVHGEGVEQPILYVFVAKIRSISEEKQQYKQDQKHVDQSQNNNNNRAGIDPVYNSSISLDSEIKANIIAYGLSQNNNNNHNNNNLFTFYAITTPPSNSTDNYNTQQPGYKIYIGTIMQNNNNAAQQQDRCVSVSLSVEVCEVDQLLLDSSEIMLELGRGMVMGSRIRCSWVRASVQLDNHQNQHQHQHQRMGSARHNIQSQHISSQSPSSSDRQHPISLLSYGKICILYHPHTSPQIILVNTDRVAVQQQQDDKKSRNTIKHTLLVYHSCNIVQIVCIGHDNNNSNNGDGNDSGDACVYILDELGDIWMYLLSALFNADLNYNAQLIAAIPTPIPSSSSLSNVCMHVDNTGRLTVVANGEQMYVGYPQLFPNYNYNYYNYPHHNNSNNINNNNNISNDIPTFLSIQPQSYLYHPSSLPFLTVEHDIKLTPYIKLLSNNPCIILHQYITSTTIPTLQATLFNASHPTSHVYHLLCHILGCIDMIGRDVYGSVYDIQDNVYYFVLAQVLINSVQDHKNNQKHNNTNTNINTNDISKCIRNCLLTLTSQHKHNPIQSIKTVLIWHNMKKWLIQMCDVNKYPIQCTTGFMKCRQNSQICSCIYKKTLLYFTVMKEMLWKGSTYGHILSKYGKNVVARIQQFDQLISILQKNNKMTLNKYIQKLIQRKQTKINKYIAKNQRTQLRKIDQKWQLQFNTVSTKIQKQNSFVIDSPIKPYRPHLQKQQLQQQQSHHQLNYKKIQPIPNEPLPINFIISSSPSVNKYPNSSLNFPQICLDQSQQHQNNLAISCSAHFIQKIYDIEYKCKQNNNTSGVVYRGQRVFDQIMQICLSYEIINDNNYRNHNHYHYQKQQKIIKTIENNNEMNVNGNYSKMFMGLVVVGCLDRSFAYLAQSLYLHSAQSMCIQYHDERSTQMFRKYWFLITKLIFKALLIKYSPFQQHLNKIFMMISKCIKSCQYLPQLTHQIISISPPQLAKLSTKYKSHNFLQVSLASIEYRSIIKCIYNLQLYRHYNYTNSSYNKQPIKQMRRMRLSDYRYRYSRQLWDNGCRILEEMYFDQY